MGRGGFLILGITLVGAFFALQACSASSASLDSSLDGEGEPGAGATGGGTNLGELPPEVELEENYLAPVVLGKKLFSANPESDRIAVVDAEKLTTETFLAGDRPEFIAVVPAGATQGGGVIAINTGSDDATLLFREKESDNFARSMVSIHHGGNAIEVSPQGSFGIVWTKTKPDAASTGDGFQDVTVLELGKSVARTRLSVGYRPSEVFVAADEKRAFVVCDPGISVIALDGEKPRVLREIFLEGSSAARDVEFSSDGKFAFVRTEGSKKLVGIRLEDDERVAIELPKLPTDLDVPKSGSYGFVVMRADGTESPLGSAGASGMGGASGEEDSLLFRFSIDSFVETPTEGDLVSVKGIFGSISLAADGSMGTLFSNGTNQPLLAILDTATLAHRFVNLKTSVLSTLVSDSGEFAVSLLAPGGPTKGGAFALVSLRKELPTRIEGTKSPAYAVALDPLDRGVLLATDGGESGASEAYWGRFPELSLETTELPSRPLHVGIVPDAARGFIAQKHPAGRITFVSVGDGTKKTLTGFELESEVVQ